MAKSQQPVVMDKLSSSECERSRDHGSLNGEQSYIESYMTYNGQRFMII